MSATSFTQAYRDAGYILDNPRNQWSARKPGGVALTVWSDEIEKGAEPWVFDCRNHPRLAEWKDRVGNSIRKKDVRWAIDNCGGRVDLILCVAEDQAASTRKIKSARHWVQRLGWIDATTFNEEDGTFRMELKPKWAQ